MKMYIIPLFYLYVAIFWYATCSNSVIIKKWCPCPIFCEIAHYSFIWKHIKKVTATIVLNNMNEVTSTYKFKKSTWLSVFGVGRSSGRLSRLYVLDRKLLERLMSPKSQVMFASAFSWIGDFFRIFGIHIFQVMASKVNLVSGYEPPLSGGCVYL